MAKIKLLEAEKKTNKILLELEDINKSPAQMKRMLTKVAKNEDVLHRWLNIITTIERHGANSDQYMSILRKAADQRTPFNEAAVRAEFDEANNFSPWHIPSVRLRFSVIICLELNARMQSLDPLTNLGSISGEGGGIGADQWGMFDHPPWMTWADRGKVGVACGAIKTGKTNLQLLDCEYAMNYEGMNVSSNIKVFDAPSSYHYDMVLSDMFLTCCESVIEGKNTLVTWDEGAMFWLKQQASRKKSVDLKKMLLCFGKLHANCLFGTHFAKDIPTDLAILTVAEFHKLSIDTAYVKISHGQRMSPRVIDAVRPTSLKYEPDQLQYFDVDIDVENLLRYMSKLDPGKGQWKEIIKYIRKHKGEVDPEDFISAEDAAKFLKRHGSWHGKPLSVRDIAELTGGRSVSTVHNWTKDVESLISD